jgi:hypothetical protein
MHGPTRQLVANRVDGVAKGFTRVLEINGVGYRAEPRNPPSSLTHRLASDRVQLPQGVTAKVERQVIITLGPDRGHPRRGRGCHPGTAGRAGALQGEGRRAGGDDPDGRRASRPPERR